jgi:hypothetical protein
MNIANAIERVFLVAQAFQPIGVNLRRAARLR